MPRSSALAMQDQSKRCSSDRLVRGPTVILKPSTIRFAWALAPGTSMKRYVWPFCRQTFCETPPSRRCLKGLTSVFFCSFSKTSLMRASRLSMCCFCCSRDRFFASRITIVFPRHTARECLFLVYSTLLTKRCFSMPLLYLLCRCVDRPYVVYLIKCSLIVFYVEIFLPLTSSPKRSKSIKCNIFDTMSSDRRIFPP